jgi:hypothetical protein
MPRRALWPTCLLAAVIAAPAALVGSVATDANVVTAIDVSASVGPRAVHGEMEGVAQALRSPEFLAAVHRGRAGRIGVAVFAWHEMQSVVLPWTVIASEADAEAAARRLESPGVIALSLAPYEPIPGRAGWGTDISRAMGFAGRLLRAAPLAAGREVVNIVGNGIDDIGEGPVAGRNRLVAAGATVNGVVFGGDPATLAYYRTEVIGGDAPFLLAADPEAGIAEAMERKFLQDLTAAATPSANGPS